MRVPKVADSGLPRRAWFPGRAGGMGVPHQSKMGKRTNLLFGVFAKNCIKMGKNLGVGRVPYVPSKSENGPHSYFLIFCIVKESFT